MKRTSTFLWTIAAAVTTSVLSAGCGGKPAEAPHGPVDGTKTASGDNVSKAAEDRFKDALDKFLAHDRANDWTDESCASIASAFEGAASASQGGKFTEAVYDAGLAYQRCGNDAQAKERFQKALTMDPKFHHARAQLALYQYKLDSNEDAAIGALDQAVHDAQFQNVPALVNLAMFQMVRDAQIPGDNCTSDMECAKRNLQRALAIDDSYMPAFNQLALYYFQSAKKRAGAVASTQKGRKGRSVATNAAMGKRADVQQLELAALVCSQALRKNAKYAPIHNTAGLIQNELGQVNNAVAEFKTAVSLDPKFFEALMNYAAVNLSFRGFEEAQKAYKKALEMRPNDYDAHLGLGLALRGQINDSNWDAQLAAVQAELDTCKKIDAVRPDAFYNEAILTAEYRAKGQANEKQIATLTSAKGMFQNFVERAADKPEYAGAMKRAKERMQDIDDTITFLQTNNAPPPANAPPPDPASSAAPAGGSAPN